MLKKKLKNGPVYDYNSLDYSNRNIGEKAVTFTRPVKFAM